VFGPLAERVLEPRAARAPELASASG
jgi:hypothetical protein